MATASNVTLRNWSSRSTALGTSKTADALDNTQFLLRVAAAVGELNSDQKKAIIKRASLEYGKVWLNIRVERVELLKHAIETTPKPFMVVPAMRNKIEDIKEILESEKHDFKDKLDGKVPKSVSYKIDGLDYGWQCLS